jgi:hypothetical protein
VCTPYSMVVALGVSKFRTNFEVRVL